MAEAMGIVFVLAVGFVLTAASLAGGIPVVSVPNGDVVEAFHHGLVSGIRHNLFDSMIRFDKRRTECNVIDQQGRFNLAVWVKTNTFS